MERAAESPPPRWGFAGRVRQHIISKGPREFASSVRALIEGLVTAYQHEAPAIPSFSVDRHFSGIPFLTLDEKLPGADDVHLDPSNFTPACRPSSRRGVERRSPTRCTSTPRGPACRRATRT